MKKPSKKYTLFIILSLIFFSMSWSLKAIYFKNDIKYIAKYKKESTKERNIEKNHNKKDYIIGISDTLSEAITYLEKNINDKNREKDVNRIIEDSIEGLLTLENAFYLEDKNIENLIVLIKDLEKNLNKLKECIETKSKDNLKSKEIIIQVKKQYYILKKELEKF